MTNKVVIDEDILGWDVENHMMLKPYAIIIKVGDDPINLPVGSPDDKIAAYCDRNNCNLFTADVEFYTDCIKAGIKTIQITNCGFWEKGQKRIFLVKIVEGVEGSKI
ncbi:MAG TPA: hypothetical protein VND01_00150 [Candidatus Acidoferrales bacterium]|nr:hypothetical protein [Candidatus Acidoferrales bacterium]